MENKHLEKGLYPFWSDELIDDTATDAELSVPIDIFTVMAERYGVSLDKLTKAYVKGALDAVAEKNEKPFRR